MKRALTRGFFLAFVLAVLVGCQKTKEPQETAEKTNGIVSVETPDAVEETVEEAVEEPSPEPEIKYPPNDLMNLIGADEAESKETIDKIASFGPFKYWKDKQNRIMAVATYSSSVPLWGISPSDSDEDIVEQLLTEQWAYKGEYIWYATNDENGRCYCSGVYQKDNYEYILTLDAESDSNTVIIVEVIDAELVNEYAKSIGDTVPQNTAFAYLHHID